jgi:hypothetical protein
VAVVEIDVEPVPQCQGIIDGLAQQALGQNFGALAQCDQIGLEGCEHRRGQFLAQAESFARVVAVRAEGGFHLVEPLNGGQHASGEGLTGFECVMEFAPCVFGASPLISISARVWVTIAGRMAGRMNDFFARHPPPFAVPSGDTVKLHSYTCAGQIR